ncbi:hypothetical protein H4Q26_000238 [Puccinia striiformis f. sp. tritici PST-130]|nr:hypothetical protein H4Q26_000238 [Puccinia striiformis f. sp. tritici PST-130]
MSSSRSNVTGRSSSHARPIRGAPQPMDGHAYTLEEINSLTAEQACWVEANPNFNDMVVPHDDEADMVVPHDDEASGGDLPFHEANQSDCQPATIQRQPDVVILKHKNKTIN